PRVLGRTQVECLPPAGHEENQPQHPAYEEDRPAPAVETPVLDLFHGLSSKPWLLLVQESRTGRLDCHLTGAQDSERQIHWIPSPGLHVRMVPPTRKPKHVPGWPLHWSAGWLPTQELSPQPQV